MKTAILALFNEAGTSVIYTALAVEGKVTEVVRKTANSSTHGSAGAELILDALEDCPDAELIIDALEDGTGAELILDALGDVADARGRVVGVSSSS